MHESLWFSMAGLEQLFRQVLRLQRVFWSQPLFSESDRQNRSQEWSKAQFGSAAISADGLLHVRARYPIRENIDDDESQ